MLDPNRNSIERYKNSVESPNGVRDYFKRDHFTPTFQNVAKNINVTLQRHTNKVVSSKFGKKNPKMSGNF